MNETENQIEALPSESSLATCPWPPAHDASLIDSFVATWMRVCFQPTAFFRALPREDHYGAVIAYYLVIGVAVAGIELFWQSVLGRWSIVSAMFPGSESRLGGVVEFLLSPIILLVTLYLVAAVCHLMLLLMRDAQHGFETSSRVFAFSYSPAIFAVIPFIGSLISFVWMIVLAIVGLREAHETDGAKAAVAVLVPVFLLICSLVVAFIGSMFMGILNTPV